MRTRGVRNFWCSPVHAFAATHKYKNTRADSELNLSQLEQRHRRHAHRLDLVREEFFSDLLNDRVHGERLVDDGRADDLLHAKGHVDEFEALGPLEPAARCVCVVRLDGVDAALTDAIDAARASTA